MPNDSLPEIPVSNLRNPLVAVAQSVNVVIGTVNQLTALLGGIAVPTKTSDLTNDSGFITSLANDLANYYLKSETYTKAETDNLISAIPKFKIEVVSALPSSNISETTVYLLAGGNESQNLYTEYIYAGNAWEKLGTQTLDLSGYATTAALSGKVDAVSGKGLSANDFTDAYKAKLDAALTEHQSLADYATKSEQNAVDGEQNRKIAALESENALLRELLQGIDAPFYRDASGNPATFDDGYPANLKELVVTLSPTQSGSGDPSPTNIRPISGTTSVTVTRTGENGANPVSVTVASVDSNNAPLTVYGGTLNVTTGELTVAQANIASYNGESLPGVWMSDRDVYAAGTSPTTGAQVVYELATPVTYQLTPAQLATLSGYNNITTDVGSVAVTYRADPAMSLQEGGAT